LLTIYSAMKNITIEEAEKHFEGCGYGELKTQTAEAVIEVLTPVRNKLQELKKDRKYLDEVAKKGAMRASELARRKLQKVYKKVGLVMSK